MSNSDTQHREDDFENPADFRKRTPEGRGNKPVRGAADFSDSSSSQADSSVSKCDRTKGVPVSTTSRSAKSAALPGKHSKGSYSSQKSGAAGGSHYRGVVAGTADEAPSYQSFTRSAHEKADRSASSSGHADSSSPARSDRLSEASASTASARGGQPRRRLSPDSIPDVLPDGGQKASGESSTKPADGSSIQPAPTFSAPRDAAKSSVRDARQGPETSGKTTRSYEPARPLASPVSVDGQRTSSSDAAADKDDASLHAKAPKPGTYSRTEATRRYTRHRRRRRRRKVLTRVLVTVIVILLLGAGAAFGYVEYLNSHLGGGVDATFRDMLAQGAAGSNEPFYMLLLGVDQSQDRISGEESQYYGPGNFRSDTIIIARLDPQNKKVTLLSMHRDIQVDLSAYGGTGKDKLNAAYAYGGPQLVTQEVEQLTGLEISHYAEVDIDGLGEIVDTLGGVEVDVPMTFYDPKMEGGLQAGPQTLNGEQALLFCRARHAYDTIGDGDVYRARNQRLFIKAMADKVLSSDIGTIVNVINTTVKYVNTDYSVGDIINLARTFQGIDVDQDVYSAMCPTENFMENGASFERIDQREFEKMIKRMDAGLNPYEDDELPSTSPTPTVTLPTEDYYRQNGYIDD